MNTIPNDDIIQLDAMGEETLAAFLREQNVSLKPNELDRIRELLGRNPTLVELHIFNTMWSEHCSYKSSKAQLKKHLPTDAPHVVLGPGEDAGIIRFFEKDGVNHCLVVAHESHNHPSQVLPVEGAATGIGGIVRDVYCMGADVIGVMDPLRFGDPDGPNGKRVREIVRGVVEGIAQYGNALGVPNWGGETYFDRSFDDNCLVNVVAIGRVTEDDIIRSRAPDAAKKEKYDIILIGKPTDASGFGGAAFASERLSGDQAEERQEAVQIPDPFLKRVLAEATKVVLAEAKEKGVAIGFKDLGAGGISCAVSEMAQAGGVGAVVDLDRVKKSSDALPAEVIACSETQERFAMMVPTEFAERVCQVYNEDFELPHIYAGAGAFVIGHLTPDKQFKMEHAKKLICDAGVDIITTGIEYEREASSRQRDTQPAHNDVPPVRDALLQMLSSYNLADKSILFQHYDSEVQGGAVLRPGEADAAVAIFIPGETVGVAAATGSNSIMGKVDPYLGGVWAVCEAVRNLACVGARPLAVTDCLNFGDPEDPAVFWEFSEAVRGIGDACRGLRLSEDGEHGVPVVSGNVSFYNQSGNGKPIAPTPIVACVGRVDDVSMCCGMGFKQVGSKIVLLGALHNKLGGSEYAKTFALAGGEPPAPDFDKETRLVRTMIDGFGDNQILAAHDIGHGGILVALTEMIIASAPFEIGCNVKIEADSESLFSEYGGILVEVDAGRWPDFKQVAEKHSIEWQELGTTTESSNMLVNLSDQQLKLSYSELTQAHRIDGKCNELFG